MRRRVAVVSKPADIASDGGHDRKEHAAVAEESVGVDSVSRDVVPDGRHGASDCGDDVDDCGDDGKKRAAVVSVCGAVVSVCGAVVSVCGDVVPECRDDGKK